MGSYEEVLTCVMQSRNYKGITAIKNHNVVVAKKPSGIILAKTLCYEKMTVSIMSNDIVPWLNRYNVRHCIIVCKSGGATRTRMTADENNVRIGIFLPQELIFDITQHVLQPKFEKLKDEDANNYNDHGSLLITDPITKWYDYQLNDVIKITKKSGAIYYRVVRSDPQ